MCNIETTRLIVEGVIVTVALIVIGVAFWAALR